jgi:hypothetical protein
MKSRAPYSRSEVAESAKILKQSSVFKEFQKEKLEINKLKWLESEKTGTDIGYEQALFMWARRHRSPWRAARKKRLMLRRK